jgi:hypothetical protein
VAGEDAVERFAHATGEVAWRWPAGGPLTLLAADPEGFLAASGDNVSLVASHDGRVAWRLRDAAGWVTGGLAGGHAVAATRDGTLVFGSRARGTESGRWKAVGGAMVAWRVSEAGARALVTAGRGKTGEVATLVAVDASGRELGREPMPRPDGLRGTPVVKFASVTTDGAVLQLEAPDGSRGWLVRRFGRQVEVSAVDGLGEAQVLPGAGDLVRFGPGAGDAGLDASTPTAGGALVFPGQPGGTWRLLSPGRPAWALALDGVDVDGGRVGGEVGPATSRRWALLVAGDAILRLDLALERIVGVGAMEGPRDALAAAWIAGPAGGAGGHAAGGWPVVARMREVVAGRATRVGDYLSRLRQAEAAGDLDEVRERRTRLGRFGATRGLLGNDAPPVPREPQVTLEPEPVAAAAATDADCAGAGCADPLALSDAEARTIATLREAWLGGDATSAVAAAAKWLARDSDADGAARRVAAALGWLLLDVAVAQDGSPPEGLAGLAKTVAGMRAGLPWLERVVWALVAARGREDDAAAAFLDARDATALGRTARRAEAARALRRMRDTAGKGAESGAKLATGLASFAHLEALFGPTAARVRALIPRLATEVPARVEFDDYAHGLGLHLVGRAPMEVELCALGCELLAERCGADHLEDACVSRCTASGVVRLATASRAAETGPGWYCGP